MPKVLIIGPNFHYFNQSVAHAFTELGWKASVEAFDTPIHPFKGLVKWRNKFARNKEKLHAKQKRKYNEYIIGRFTTEHPDLVFILNGDILTTETLDFFRKKSKVALWLFDSIKNISNSTEHIKHVDACFCYEQEDINFYTQRGDKAYFLPQAYDAKLYFPMQTTKQYDIVFAGDIYQSKKRQEILQAVIEQFPKAKIRFWGIYKPWYKGIWSYITREHKDIYTNKNASVDVLNEAYNQAKIVLNIHVEQQKNGANPKVFEICASGAYQICDYNPFINTLFPNKEVGLYKNKEELFVFMAEALEENKNKEAAEAHKIIAAHTFVKRIEKVLATLNLK